MKIESSLGIFEPPVFLEVFLSWLDLDPLLILHVSTLKIEPKSKIPLDFEFVCIRKEFGDNTVNTHHTATTSSHNNLPAIEKMATPEESSRLL